MKEFHNQQKHSVVKVISVLLIVALIAVVGWVIYKNQHKASTTSETTSSTPTKPAESHLVIPQWGIKVKLGSADPALLTYDLNGPSSGATGPLAASAVLGLKSSVTAITACQILGIVIEQGQVSGYNGSGAPSNVVGNYYYSATGEPASCGVAALDAVRANYTGNNPNSWTYSSDN